MNNNDEPKQYDAASKKHLLEAGNDMGTSVKNASVDVPSLAVTTSQGRESTMKAKDKAVLTDVFDECWPRDIQTGIPYPLKKTPRFRIAAPLYIERIFYATFNYRARYTADNHIYAKETVLTNVHLVMYMKQGNVRNYLARHFFLDEGQDGQGDPRPVPTFGGKPILSTVKRNNVVSLPLAGTAGPKLHGLVGVLAQQQKRAGGIIKHNTNAVKNLAATQAVPGDNVDEGNSPEPPAKKVKQPAKPSARGPARGRGGTGARAGGGALSAARPLTGTAARAIAD
eukprot:jgi/Tetstr1/462126/TSEL_007194.t1